jgi:dimethylaniline monooxygenase (N-oxide forming)
MECQVTNVEQLHNSDMAGAAPLNLDDRKANYKVEWLDLNTQKANCRDFGGVVIASGFFHTPCMPAFLQQYINMNNNEYAPGCSRRLQMIHSSQYRSHNEFKDKNVAVIGGSFSSLEIATDVSKSAARVVNVLPTIPWVLPRWIYKFHPFLSSESVVSGNNAKTITILPTDLALYQRTQPFRYQGEFKELTPEACQERHQYVQSLIGEKQRNSQLGEPTNWDEPTIVTISDEYVDLVNEEKIHVLQGRLVGIDDDGRLQINDTTGDTNHAPLTLLDDIDHVICATGYKPNLHNFLSSQILSTLDYDQEDKFSPMTLAYDTLHPSLPNLAFCGLYKGPYMGVLDLQARLAAKLMSGSLSIDDETYKIATKTSERMRKSSPRAQFPHFYPDLMDTLAQLLNSDKCEGELGIVVPPLYSADGCVRETCRLDLEREIKRGQDGSRMPRLVLGSILGSWGYDRSIVHLKTGKKEHVSGTVKVREVKCSFSSSSMFFSQCMY